MYSNAATASRMTAGSSQESQLRRFSFFLLVNRLGSVLNVKNPMRWWKCFDGHEGAGLDCFRNLVAGVLAK